jgi:hypothetical protein
MLMPSETTTRIGKFAWVLPLAAGLLPPAALSADSKYGQAHETFANKAAEGPEHTGLGLTVVLLVALLILLGALWTLIQRRKKNH